MDEKEEIFKELDEAINESISPRPKILEQSNFIRKYKEIKNKWLKK